jgi:hypothetical protein
MNNGIRWFVVVSLAALSVTAGADVKFGSTVAEQMMQDYAAKVSQAQTVHIEFAQQLIGDAERECTAVLVRPNHLVAAPPSDILDDPKRVAWWREWYAFRGVGVIKASGLSVYFDGTTITVTLGSGQYMTEPQSPEALAKLFDRNELRPIGLMLCPEMYKSQYYYYQDRAKKENYEVDTGGMLVRNGVELKTLAFKIDKHEERTVTMWLDPQDELPREALFETKLNGGTSLAPARWVIVVHKMTLDDPAKPGETTFDPTGYRRIAWISDF